MEAPLTTSFSRRAADDSLPLLWLARQVFPSAAALVALLCLFLALRGAQGVLQAPASTGLVILAALGAEAFAGLYRIAWQSLYGSATRRARWALWGILPALCVACVVVALSLSGTPMWARTAVWLVVISGEAVWWLPELRAARRGRDQRDATREAPTADEPTQVELDELAPEVLQQLTRSRSDGGLEVISGLLRAEFTAGQQTHNLHVAFCPPLDYVPQVTAQQLDGPPVTIKVAQAEVFGMRLELRRTAGTEASSSGAVAAATIYFEVHPA